MNNQRCANNFKELAEMFYNHNFGQASKQEIEIFMFHAYMDGLREDKKTITDYTISKKLGITQQRVRNLRIKENLVYGLNVDWKKELVRCISNARYEDPFIVMDIPDPNVLLEVKNYLEENGKYADTRINKRLLSIRVEFFMDLSMEVDSEKTAKEIFKSLVTKIKRDEKYNTIDLKPIVSAQGLVEAGVAVSSIICNLAEIVSPDNMVIKVLNHLMLK